MSIVEVTQEIKDHLSKSNFSMSFLDNCLNSKFLSIHMVEKKIVGLGFVGGILNSYGIEIIKEFRGKGLGKKLLNEIIDECKIRKISFLTGVFKPSNAASISIHTKVGFVPIFSFYYNENEGREIIVILPFNKKGIMLMQTLRIFNTKIGNFFFAVIFKICNPLLKNLIAFTGSKMSKMDFNSSIKNFNKVQVILNEIT